MKNMKIDQILMTVGFVVCLVGALVMLLGCSGSDRCAAIVDGVDLLWDFDATEDRPGCADETFIAEWGEVGTPASGCTGSWEPDGECGWRLDRRCVDGAVWTVLIDVDGYITGVADAYHPFVGKCTYSLLVTELP